MKPARVVLDTNVILSAVLCGGNPAEYFALALAQAIRLFVSPFILEELASVLKRKFCWSKNNVHALQEFYLALATEVEVTEPVTLIQRKKSDNEILATALAAEADYLVTGDKRDLLPLKSFRGIRIVSPIEGLSLLSSPSR